MELKQVSITFEVMHFDKAFAGSTQPLASTDKARQQFSNDVSSTAHGVALLNLGALICIGLLSFSIDRIM